MATVSTQKFTSRIGKSTVNVKKNKGETQKCSWLQFNIARSPVFHCTLKINIQQTTCQHGWLWKAEPKQLAPPLSGAGLAQLLVRVFLPAWHPDQTPQQDHWPSVLLSVDKINRLLSASDMVFNNFHLKEKTCQYNH